MIKKVAVAGMHVNPGDELYTIADLSHIWINGRRTRIPSCPLSKSGRQRRWRSPMTPQQCSGDVSRFSTQPLITQTRTAKVRFELTNPGERLKPGMYANVELEDPPRHAARGAHGGSPGFRRTAAHLHPPRRWSARMAHGEAWHPSWGLGGSGGGTEGRRTHHNLKQLPARFREPAQSCGERHEGHEALKENVYGRGRIIDFSARNKYMVFLFIFGLAMGGWWAMRNTPIDAIPDISDTQVIIYTTWMGRSPDLVEDQITYPIVTALLSAPRVTAVRGFSDFGYSYCLRPV